ncbi:RNA 2',3'-cyclic phosphodiesterase, partial [Streptomyces triticagri]
LALRGGGRFGDRALWAGVSGDRATLRRLAERARAAGRKAGIDREDPHGFTPHLTLARAGRRPGGEPAAGPAPALAPFVEALRAFEGSEWTVSQLSLVLSRLPRSGVPGERPRYEEVGRWALGADG